MPFSEDLSQNNDVDSQNLLSHLLFYWHVWICVRNTTGSSGKTRFSLTITRFLGKSSTFFLTPLSCYDQSCALRPAGMKPLKQLMNSIRNSLQNSVSGCWSSCYFSGNRPFHCLLLIESRIALYLRTYVRIRQVCWLVLLIVIYVLLHKTSRLCCNFVSV